MEQIQDEYKSNKILNLLLIIGYSAFIPYITCYFYNVYRIIKRIDYVNERGEEILSNGTTPTILTSPIIPEYIFTIMIITSIILLIVTILSIIFIVIDAKKL